MMNAEKIERILDDALQGFTLDELSFAIGYIEAQRLDLRWQEGHISYEEYLDELMCLPC